VKEEKERLLRSFLAKRSKEKRRIRKGCFAA
jgi:hypothetical protein